MNAKFWKRGVIAVVITGVIGWGLRYYNQNYTGGLYQPMGLAVARGDVERIRYLVHEKGFGVSKYTMGVAVDYGRLEVLRVFVEELGVNVDTPGIRNETILMQAAEQLRPEFVSYLLNQGADPNLADKSGERALYSAIRWPLSYYEAQAEKDRIKRMEIVRLLVKANAEIDADGGAALRKVVVRGEIKLAEYLLRSGANPNAAHEGGRGALVLAGTREIAELLVSYDADVHQINDKGESVLQFVVQQAEDTEVVEYLLEQGADPCHLSLGSRSVFDFTLDADPDWPSRDVGILQDLREVLIAFEQSHGLNCGWASFDG